MICSKSKAQKYLLLTLALVVVLVVKVDAQDLNAGKQLFNGRCASCHNIFKPTTGPALGGFQEKEYYAGDKQKIYEWIRNASVLSGTNPYFQELKAQFGGAVMTSFPSLTDQEIDNIVAYIDDTYKKGQSGPKESPDSKKPDPETSNRNAIIFGVISLIMAIIAFILMQVNSNLKKLSDDKEGVLRPEPVPFWRNKVYITIVVMLLFVAGGYYLAKGAIGLGRQKNYQPVQPIFYSHKVHAGINQINCLYCHGNAMESKHAAIPSTNVCMNCHKNITEYTQGPQLYDENGNEINGTLEIQKLYSYAGFDPKNPNAWDPAKAKPIPWVRIHNLPDHVYFNHSQHVKAGNVQCQTCHGEITAMDIVYQFSELSMGWCVNCHRETKVNFNYTDSTGNKFYSIYEKFHQDIVSGKMDSVTVKDIGGLECQKCHY